MKHPDATGASFNRGNSRQNYETPRDLISAIEIRFGERFEWDLAATPGTQKAPRFIAPPGTRDHAGPVDAFSDLAFVNVRGLCWLNPPFDALPKWSALAARVACRERRVVFLAPAAVSTNWFAENVWPHARVLAIRPRVKFVGESNGFPKDLMLALYGFGIMGAFDTWRWDGKDEG